MLNKIYKDLFDLNGIAAYENEVRAYMRKFMEQYPNYEIVTDNLGSIFARKIVDPALPTVMVAGHMDEVGLIVKQITNKGMLKLLNAGGLNGEIFISQVLNVHTKKGIIKGVVGAIPPHMKTTQNTSIEDLILDIGATSKAEALEFGVELGNMVLYPNPFNYTANKKRVISKAVDNRFGCGLALEAIKYFHNKELPYNIVIGATVQEEVGLRGAETITNLINPDVFIALDASPVNDIVDDSGFGKLGSGFLIRMYDPRNIMQKSMLDYFTNLAVKNNLKHQHFLSMGGTDAAKAYDLNEGTLATTIGLPARYIHSTAAMFDLADLEEAKKMLFLVLRKLNPKVIKKLKEENR